MTAQTHKPPTELECAETNLGWWLCNKYEEYMKTRSEESAEAPGPDRQIHPDAKGKNAAA